MEALPPFMPSSTITLLVDGQARRKVTLPSQDALTATPEGACPGCGTSPFQVQGMGRRPSSDDRAWEADAQALCCKKLVGVLRLDVNTLFGVREDEAVFRQAGVRIY